MQPDISPAHSRLGSNPSTLPSSRSSQRVTGRCELLANLMADAGGDQLLRREGPALPSVSRTNASNHGEHGDHGANSSPGSFVGFVRFVVGLPSDPGPLFTSRSARLTIFFRAVGLRCAMTCVARGFSTRSAACKAPYTMIGAGIAIDGSPHRSLTRPMAARWQTLDDEQQTAGLAARPAYTGVRMLEKRRKTATSCHFRAPSGVAFIAADPDP